MIRKYFNAGRGDISQTGIAQVNREVSRPANSAGGEGVVCQKRARVLTMEHYTSSRTVNSRDTRGIRGGAGAWGTKAAWYGPAGTGLDRRLLHVDEASEGGLVVGEEPRDGRRE